MHTLILGLFSSGKTTVGKKVAHCLGLPFYDSDWEIEQEQKEDCRSYFQKVGEVGFRQKECEILQKLITRPSGILACGGGAPLTQSKDVLMHCPQRIYLNYSLESVLKSFPARGVPFFITDLKMEYSKRTPFYDSLATKQLNCDGLKIEDIVFQIIKLISY